MKNYRGFVFVLTFVSLLAWSDRFTIAELPKVLDDSLTLELVAEHPQIVTPVGLDFDRRGRLLVIESHTHFPPDGYKGPKSDRIRIVEDLDGDGRADRFRSFLEGTRKTMSIRRGPDNWMYVATRMQIFRARDTNGDDQADERQVIATLRTDGDYPHNGLCGLCFDADGTLYFGLGENLGKSYTLVGKDGTKISGGGEGGNIYRCQADGTGLRQIATGFWNPFGICFDSVGRMFTVGNDPDASPPCRLVHVVDGGDYGYQFRYGRSGKHPLQAWDGELPGTLPMVAGTSEAPSSVLPWHGQLYVSSWGEYRIERFKLRSKGASVTADREVVVQGDRNFRPVDFAVAPDGSLYFTDWVDRSYNVHGKGRIWRLRWKKKPVDTVVAGPSADERRAEQALTRGDADALRSQDPFLHHAAMMHLVKMNQSRPNIAKEWREAKHGRTRLALIEAARLSKWKGDRRERVLRLALADTDPDVRLYAVRWIADDRLADFRDSLDQLLEDESATAAQIMAVLAARQWLDTGRVDNKKVAGEAELVAALQSRKPSRLQVIALKALPANHSAMTAEVLANLLSRADRSTALRQESARSLAVSEAAEAERQRLRVATDRSLPADLRADAMAGIAVNTKTLPTLRKLVDDQQTAVRLQVRRMLANARSPADAPKEKPTDRHLEQIKAATKSLQGDASRGWRVFFGRGAARCADCHRLDGRGADVGPDLTGIGNRMSRDRLLQSIIQPSAEISPRYVPWTVVTDSGRSFTAMSLGVRNDREEFLSADGKRFNVPQDSIEQRRLNTISIMPDDLHRRLTPQDVADLLQGFASAPGERR